MTEEISQPAKKKTKRPLTRKEAIRKGNKDFRNMARELAKTMNAKPFIDASEDKKKKA